MVSGRHFDVPLQVAASPVREEVNRDGLKQLAEVLGRLSSPTEILTSVANAAAPAVVDCVKEMGGETLQRGNAAVASAEVSGTSIVVTGIFPEEKPPEGWDDAVKKAVEEEFKKLGF